MSKTIYVDNKNWHKEVYEKTCKCGHALYLHGFTMGRFSEDEVELRVSQCTMCGFNKETQKFECEGFTSNG